MVSRRSGSSCNKCRPSLFIEHVWHRLSDSCAIKERMFRASVINLIVSHNNQHIPNNGQHILYRVLGSFNATVYVRCCDLIFFHRRFCGFSPMLICGDQFGESLCYYYESTSDLFVAHTKIEPKKHTKITKVCSVARGKQMEKVPHGRSWSHNTSLQHFCTSSFWL